MAEQSLKDKTAKGLFWGGGEQWGAADTRIAVWYLFVSHIIAGRLWDGRDANYFYGFCECSSRKRLLGGLDK